MNHIFISDNSKCCGCRNCENICPKKAITMVENKEGFLYPIIDKSKCINCGMCKKVCPWINNLKRHNYFKTPMCYAAKAKNKTIQKKSSSGGIFSILALYVLDKKGIVIGSELDSFHKVHHVIIDKKEDLYRIVGSKYVYSDLGNIFIKIKKELNSKKIVLFSGLPCQVSALLTFLSKPYSNLITVEVICHGIPSQKLFDKYVFFLEKKYFAKMENYQFRSKFAANWGTFKALVTFIRTKKNNFQKAFFKKINADFDPYYWSFLNCKNYRESCYKCKFAKSNRNADITLGDFWGIETVMPTMIDYDGVSVVIVNTDKGNNVFNKIKNMIEYNSVSYDLVQANNGQLRKPSKRPIERDNWYSYFDAENFINSIKIKPNIRSYIKLFIPQKLKFKIKKIILNNK